MVSVRTAHMSHGPRTATRCSAALLRNPAEPAIRPEAGHMPTLPVVAGRNGRGKFTLTRNGGFRGAEVIDPDTFACGESPDKSTSAAREALRRRKAALGKSRSHLIETASAGSEVLRHMEAAQREGC